MKSGLTTALVSGALLLLAPSMSIAEQRPAPTPEQRIERLEKQVQQVQRQVFPKGRPADTAGFSDDPAATQTSVMAIDQRLDALEKQMADLVRLSEENGNRLRGVEAGMGQLKTDEDQRIAALEQRIAQAQPAPQVQPSETVPVPGASPTKGRPAGTGKASVKSAFEVPSTSTVAEAVATTDPGEEAYTQGFHQWEAGQFDQAISTLKAFTAAYPKHKRVSYANNLIGRAMLDKGDARGAATTLLANYRTNPGGERAPDSLYYLGQALMKLGQPRQACKAYAEMDAVYGAKIRPDLKKLEAEGRAQAQCS